MPFLNINIFLHNTSPASSWIWMLPVMNIVSKGIYMQDAGTMSDF